MKLVFDLIGGKVLDPDLPSPLGGLGRNKAEERKKKKRDGAREMHDPVCQPESLGSKVSVTHAHFLDKQA